MKILRIIARLNIGGPTMHVVLAAHGFHRLGYEHVLAIGNVPSGEGNMEYYAERWSVPVVRIGGLSREISLPSDLLALWNIYRLIRRERPDVVHTHTAKAGTLGRVAAIFAGAPIIVHTYHGHVFEGYFPSWKTRLFVHIERLLARFTDRLIVVSKSQREELTERYRIAGPEKVEVIQLGLDLAHLSDLPPGEDGVEPTVGWIGRLTGIKDPLLFVEFADAAQNDAGDLRCVRFLLFGDGELRSCVAGRIAESAVPGQIVLRGWQQDTRRIYSELDIVVLTSKNEGTPVALIEAMAAARPFIAVNVGGVADLMIGRARPDDGFTIFDNGVLIERRDVGAFVRALRFLLADPALRMRMGAAGRTFVMRHFSKERLVGDLSSLYRELAEQRNRCSAKERSLNS